MKRILGRVTRLLQPAPIDAWILVSIIYWVTAALASILWYVESIASDSFDLNAPVVVGAFAMILAVFLGRFAPSASWRIPMLFLATILGGIVLYLGAGSWLGVQPFRDFESYLYFGFDEVGEEPSLSEYLQFYAVHPLMILGLSMLTLILLSGIPFVRRIFSGITRLAPKSISLLDRHRQSLMIAFAAITIPATMIRNALPFEHQSSPYLWTPLSAVLGIGAVLTGIYVLGRFVVNRKWLKLKVTACLAIMIATSAVLYFANFMEKQRFDCDPHTIGKDVSVVLVPIFFGLSLLAVILIKNDRTAGKRSKRFSPWTFFMPLSVAGSIAFAVSSYDPYVPANTFLESPRRFAKFRWVQHAKDSRLVQRNSRGAARLVGDGRRMSIAISIRDERDADCLSGLFDLPFIQTTPLLIENIRPFVDTGPLARHPMNLSIIGGQLTSAQVVDISKVGRMLAVSNVRMPEAGDGITLTEFSTFGNKPIPGLANFLDAGVLLPKAKVHIAAPLTREDLESVVRISQHCSVLIGSVALLPDEGRYLANLGERHSLSSIQFNSIELERNRDARSFLRFDAQVNYLTLANEQQYWDFIFANRNIKNIWLRSRRSQQDFKTKTRQFNWAYQWNERGEITHLWAPSIDELGDQEGFLREVTTLRVDRRGYLSGGPDRRVDLHLMPAMPKLERLYLPTEWEADSIESLKRFPNLQHLQVRHVNRANMKRGYDVCENLESIQFFGTPGLATAGELSGLKALRKVTIVDDDFFLLSPQGVPYLNSLKSKLPGVTIEVVSPDDYEPDLSQAMKQHQAEIGERLFRQPSDN